MNKSLALILLSVLLTGCTAGKPAPATTEKPPVQAPPLVVPAPKAFRVGDLQNTKEIRIWESHGGTRTISDPATLQAVLAKLQGAVFFSSDRSKADRDGFSYVVSFIGKDGSLNEMTAWPGGGTPNLADTQRQEWWIVPGLDEVLVPLAPSQNITLDDAQQIVQAIDPNAEWWPHGLLPKGNWPASGEQVLEMAGFTPAGTRILVFIDPVNGKVLKQYPPETTAAAAAALQRYYELTSQGNYVDAWKLVHPTAQAPRGQSVEAEFRKQTTPSARLTRINRAAWERDYWKFYGCQCMIFDSAYFEVSLSDGSTAKVHVAQDGQGAWKVFWSPDIDAPN